MSIPKAIGIVGALLSLAVLSIWALVQFAGVQGSLLWTGIAGAIAWAIRNSIEKKRVHVRLLAEKKRAHYLEFLDFITSVIGQTKAADAEAEGATSDAAQELSIAEFRKWSLRLTLLGSDEVVRAWNTARAEGAEAQGAEAGVTVLVAWGKLWLAMRKDCGHPDTKLTVPEVLASFVNDIDQYGDMFVEKG